MTLYIAVALDLYNYNAFAASELHPSIRDALHRGDSSLSYCVKTFITTHVITIYNINTYHFPTG